MMLAGVFQSEQGKPYFKICSHEARCGFVHVSSGFRFHPGTRLALLRNQGPLSFEEWENTARLVLEQSTWRGTRRILSDRRRMAGGFPPGMAKRALAFFIEHAQALGEVQWAVVVPDDSAAFDTVRLAAELSKSTRVRVQGFTDLAVALRWILGTHHEDQIAGLTQWIEDDE